MTEPAEGAAASRSSHTDASPQREHGHATLLSSPGVVPVTPIELKSWYAIDFSNSVYSTVGISGFLPLLLQAAALSAARFPSVCENLVTDPALVAAQFPYVAGQDNVTAMYFIAEGVRDVCLSSSGPTCHDNWCPGWPTDTLDCRVGNSTEPFPLRVAFGGAELDPTSYATLSIAISVLAQALVFVLIGAATDYGSNRKTVLLGASMLGGIFSIACAGITPAVWWIGAPLMIVSNVCFGITTITYNSYLPPLVRALPEVLAFSAAHPKGSPHAVRDRLALEDAKASELSSKGFAWGYIAGVVGILLALPGAVTLSDIAAYQVAMVICGVWWMLFMLGPWLYLLPRPGPPLPPGETYAGRSLHQLKSTIAIMCKLRVTGYYLMCWMIGSDAIFTIGTMGGLFSATQVKWGCFPRTLGILSVFLLVPICAAIGNMVYLRAQQQFGLSARSTLLLTMAITGVICVYALIGFVSDDIGLRNGWEVILMGAWYGFGIGAYQSFSRSIFAGLIPPGHEGAFYSLYELTNKGSSAIGPVVLTAIQQLTGDLRWGFIFILVNIALPMAVIARLDLPAGVAAARAFVQQDAGARGSDDADDQHPHATEESGGVVNASVLIDPKAGPASGNDGDVDFIASAPYPGSLRFVASRSESADI